MSIIGFIIATLLFLIGLFMVVMGGIARKENKPFSKEKSRNCYWIGSILAVVGIAVCGFNCIYTQDAGEVNVIRNFGGSIAGHEAEPGLHFKAPWQDIVTYDTRNNVVSFIKDGTEDYFGGSANGPQVTVNDSAGASANIDIQVNYSLSPEAATELYKNYGTQENFVRNVVAVDVRSVPRELSGQFTTIEMLTNRGEFSHAIQEALAEKWADDGLIVEQVTVQDVRYSQSIIDSYTNAQVSDVERQRAENQQAVAEIEAETLIIEAQGEASANEVLAQSLSPEILYYQYIQALNNAGGIYVVPDDSNSLISIAPEETQKEQ